ncbi:MAG: hypothetical protein ABR538_09635 [Candidatus Binatia bacterium]
MMSAAKPPRYRVEGDRTCIDIRLNTSQQLFDRRDPSPFRERDLDENAIDYIRASAEDIPLTKALKLVLVLEEPASASLPAAEIESAIRAQFEYERGRVNRLLRQQRRFGHVALGVGLTVLVLLLSLAQMAEGLPGGHVREILREGLVITGWVAMWRPIEVLLYDWWPHVQHRKQIARILAAEVEVRFHDAAASPGLP